MSKSAHTTKASFVYENTSKSTVGEGLLPGWGWEWAVWNQNWRRGSLGLAGGEVWYVTAVDLWSLGSVKGQVGGRR